MIISFKHAQIHVVTVFCLFVKISNLALFAAQLIIILLEAHQTLSTFSARYFQNAVTHGDGFK